MLIGYKRGQGSIILRVKLLDSAVSTGAGKTGLTHSSSGLIISTIADNEATATVYAQGSSNVETITTLGTFAAPTSSKCRFKEVDATNHKGIYEIQIADARYAVSSAKSLLVSISGITGVAECDVVIPLFEFDLHAAAAVCNKIADHVKRRTQANTEASSDGDSLSLHSLYGAVQQAQEYAVSGATQTIYQTDGITSLGTRTLDTDAAADPVVGST